jgi:hypothetical protein
LWEEAYALGGILPAGRPIERSKKCITRCRGECVANIFWFRAWRLAKKHFSASATRFDIDEVKGETD